MTLLFHMQFHRVQSTCLFVANALLVYRFSKEPIENSVRDLVKIIIGLFSI